MIQFDDNFFYDFRSADEIKFKKKCEQLVKETNNRTIVLLDTIEKLKIFLIDTASDNRKRGIKILNNILTNLHVDILTEKEFGFICGFYMERLNEHHEVVPEVLNGILILTNLKLLPNGVPVKILAEIFAHITCQQQQQQDRFCIYMIFKLFLVKYNNELQAMSLDLVHGIISAVDGERDPKNLYFLFNWFPQFFKCIDLQHLAEESFEVLACYFPVDFKAASNENHIVTRDILANSLAECLTSTPLFAEYCMALVLEKLESTLELALLDSLKLLVLGATTFSISFYSRNLLNIWALLQKHLYETKNVAIQTACLNTMGIILKKIASDQNFKDNLLPILESLKRRLVPDLMIFNITSDLLITITKSSKIAYDLMNKHILSMVINTNNITQEIEFKGLLLNLLIRIKQISVKDFNNLELNDNDTILLLCYEALVINNENYRCVGLYGISELVTILKDDLRMKIYEILTLTITRDFTIKEQFALEKCLIALSNENPKEAEDNIFKAAKITDQISLQCYLKNLFLLLPKHELQSFILKVFMEHLSADETAFVTIQSFKERLDANNTKLNENDEEKLLELLFNWSTTHLNCNNDKLLSLHDLFNIVIRKLETNRQQHFFDFYYPRIKALFFKQQTKACVMLLSSFCCTLRESCENAEAYELVFRIYIESNEDDFERFCSIKLLANLVNKNTNDNALDSLLNQIYALDEREHFVLFTWITKAIIMKNNKHGKILVQKCITTLKRNPSNTDLPKNMELLLNPDVPGLNRASYCKISVLYRQKAFNEVTNSIIENMESEESLLLAFAYVLKHSPKQSVLMEFKNISKVILNIFDNIKNSEALTIILNCIAEVISNKEKIMEEEIHLFMPRLLSLLEMQHTMKIRILIIQCIRDYSFYPLHIVILYKQQVLSILRGSVDDKKRMVRREATETILLWSLIDS